MVAIAALIEIEGAQQEAMQAKQAQFADASRLEKQLRRWSSRAARLDRRAIRQHTSAEAHLQPSPPQANGVKLSR